MKQTAVDWLVKKFMTENTTREGWHEIFEQAKQMEKEQIEKAYEDGCWIKYDSSEQYYNKTFKSE